MKFPKKMSVGTIVITVKTNLKLLDAIKLRIAGLSNLFSKNINSDVAETSVEINKDE